MFAEDPRSPCRRSGEGREQSGHEAQARAFGSFDSAVTPLRPGCRVRAALPTSSPSRERSRRSSTRGASSTTACWRLADLRPALPGSQAASSPARPSPAEVRAVQISSKRRALAEEVEVVCVGVLLDRGVFSPPLPLPAQRSSKRARPRLEEVDGCGRHGAAVWMTRSWMMSRAPRYDHDGRCHPDRRRCGG